VNINPDAIVLFETGVLRVNVTLAYTWLVMAILTFGSWLITRRLSADVEIRPWQNAFEVVVEAIQRQIKGVARTRAASYLPFIGTLFLFIALSNLLAVVPGFRPPTASLTTTAALATCVFVAVPIYGVSRRGIGGYLRQYVEPSVFMLPFNILGELSRTLALAVRLYGNVMSGTVIAGILLVIAPLFFPVVMQLLGLLTGMIQAYIFAVLAMVYIVSATTAQAQTDDRDPVADDSNLL
jgi:F-type H+-transporting ATPase subunit a